MQFSTLTLALLAATAASALPEPGKPKGGWGGWGGSKKDPKPSKPPKSSKPDNDGGSSSWGWDAANLGISAAGLASDLATTFSGNKDRCETLNKGSGCWKGYCWSACSQDDPTWWAWAAESKGGNDYVSCSAESECVGQSYEISAEGCGC